VRAYCHALGQEALAAGLSPEAAAHATFFDARHPHLDAVIRAVEEAAEAGRPAALAEVQHAVLGGAWLRAEAHYAGQARQHGPESGDRAWAAFGIDSPAAHRAWCQKVYTDRAGGSWAALWRAGGRTDPATLAALGFAAAELALLAEAP
jgi:hypothetical protein